MSTAISTYGGQARYELAQPADSETPDMYWDVHGLVNGEDADLLTYEQFKDVADERIFDLLPEGWLFEFLRESAVSLEPNRRLAAKPIRKALEQIAGEMLDEAHAEAVKKFQAVGYEP